MNLFKAITKGFGTSVNDKYTRKQVKKSGEKAYDKVAKDIEKAKRKGYYLRKDECARRYSKYKKDEVEKAKSKGKARDRFFDGL